ncbi:MAG TPA: hypothetical protein VFS08_15200 [Gemmatimonadaceae bacterium]|nr:hypothetical protein [Gemmatimonadaceae bacterium]
MTSIPRAFLIGEALAFGTAALVHRGVLADGYQHRNAFIAETIITAVLVAGLVAGWLAPRRAWAAAVAAQAFALVATSVGIVTIAVGVGPRTVPDVVYHLVIVAVLTWGLVVALRGPAGATARD